jgi:DNA-binding GntR family transcriptional regulator
VSGREVKPAVTPQRLAVESVVDRVYAVLRARILAGELEPGRRLRQEALAEQLGVSRTPLREALRRLSSEGLVEIRPHHGAAVTPFTAVDMAAAFMARLLLEPPAARLAAEARTAGDLARMRDAIATHRRADVPVEETFAANRAFHLAVVGASANSFLIRFAEQVWAAPLGFAIYSRQAEPPERVLADAAEHEAIADAVDAHDGERAEALMHDHIDAARLGFLELQRGVASA